VRPVAATLATAAAAEVTDSLLRTQLLALLVQMSWGTKSLHPGHDLVMQGAQVAAGVDPRWRGC
jgi:hypothetical protein